MDQQEGLVDQEEGEGGAEAGGEDYEDLNKAVLGGSVD